MYATQYSTYSKVFELTFTNFDLMIIHDGIARTILSICEFTNELRRNQDRSNLTITVSSSVVLKLGARNVETEHQNLNQRIL